uniref:Uncharacterized protein n=1 Tax=Ciona intestinalis TaxID=7719 RepID=H2XZW4_CIOIN
YFATSFVPCVYYFFILSSKLFFIGFYLRDRDGYLLRHSRRHTQYLGSQTFVLLRQNPILSFRFRFLRRAFVLRHRFRYVIDKQHATVLSVRFVSRRFFMGPHARFCVGAC